MPMRFNPIMNLIWTPLILMVIVKATTTQDLHLPLTLSFPREWHISPTNTLPESKVSQIKLSQESAHHLNVSYGLEPSYHADVSGFFRVERADGGVYWLGKENQTYPKTGFLQITASAPGTAVSKVEVMVKFGEDKTRRGQHGLGSGNFGVPAFFTTIRTTPTTPINAITTPTITTISSTITTTTSVTPLTEPPSKSTTTTTFLITIFSIATAILLLLLMGIYFIRHRLIARKTKILTKQKSQPPPQVAIPARALSNRYEESPKHPNTPEETDPWAIPRHRIQIHSILGEGCFGQVWRATLTPEGTTIACKTLKESASPQDKADLLSELAVLKSLEPPHPNVVRLVGCCLGEPPLILLEYVALGKLQSFLRSSRSNSSYNNLHSDSGTLTSKDLTSFSLQVAKGMDYLSQKGIIHRDLAARNVLIDKDRMTCKVADFGFARDVMGVEGEVYERKSGDGRLPIRWMAPESLYDSLFTTKSDVWSFGVLMWEIVTLGSTPYPGLSPSAVISLLRTGHRLEKPLHCKRELYNIMFYCWNEVPEERPSFTNLAHFLASLIEEDQEYIQLDLFPEHSYINLSESGDLEILEKL